MSLENNQLIIQYYRECNNAYRDAWNMDKNMQLNLGLWPKGTKNLSQALGNLNNEVATKAEITSNSVVLDAGCGVGGTAIFLAKTFACKVIGISLVTDQIERATQNAKAAKVDHLVSFLEMDYTATKWPDEFFDVIIGIESICYANPKVSFLSEAFRLLKKGGNLVLAENIQAKEKLSDKEYKSLYTNAFNGCQVSSLDTEKNYIANLNHLGFTHHSIDDYTKLIRPSILRLRRIYYLAAAYNFAHRLIGKRFSKIQEANTKMCYHLYSSLQKGLWKYDIIKAVK